MDNAILLHLDFFCIFTEFFCLLWSRSESVWCNPLRPLLSDTGTIVPPFSMSDTPSRQIKASTVRKSTLYRKFRNLLAAKKVSNFFLLPILQNGYYIWAKHCKCYLLPKSVKNRITTKLICFLEIHAVQNIITVQYSTK